MKLMILGNARHGKDSVCEILARDYGLSFVSSSKFVATRAVEPYLKARGLTYDSFDEMYSDRVNHRELWFKAIAEFNGEDLARLGKELLSVHDIYCGMRRKEELDALKATGLLDFTIWVDASKRLPPEDASSITVTEADADYVLDNNGPVEALAVQVKNAIVAARLHVET